MKNTASLRRTLNSLEKDCASTLRVLAHTKDELHRASLEQSYTSKVASYAKLLREIERSQANVVRNFF